MLGGDVIGGEYFLARRINRLAGEVDVSTVLPVVEGDNIPGRVALHCDLDGTVFFEFDYLAAQNGCLIRVRLDFDAGLHANCQLCASTRG